MDELYTILIALIFNLLDLVSGLVLACKSKSIDSSKLRDGLFKKFGFVICYFVAWLLDSYGARIGFNIGIDLLPVIILYVCGTEVVSILENISGIAPNILPPIFKQFLQKFKEKED